VFANPITRDLAVTPIDAVSFDLDADQRNEIAVLLADGDVAILRVEGDTLVAGPTIHVDGASAIAAGDLDLDGRDDLVFAQPVNRRIAVRVWDP
jgi:hypothetical protein